jgi:hypothetical protein
MWYKYRNFISRQIRAPGRAIHHIEKTRSCFRPAFREPVLEFSSSVLVTLLTFYPPKNQPSPIKQLYYQSLVALCLIGLLMTALRVPSSCPDSVFPF